MEVSEAGVYLINYGVYNASNTTTDSYMVIEVNAAPLDGSTVFLSDATSNSGSVLANLSANDSITLNIEGTNQVTFTAVNGQSAYVNLVRISE